MDDPETVGPERGGLSAARMGPAHLKLKILYP